MSSKAVSVFWYTLYIYIDINYKRLWWKIHSPQPPALNYAQDETGWTEKLRVAPARTTTWWAQPSGTQRPTSRRVGSGAHDPGAVRRAARTIGGRVAAAHASPGPARIPVVDIDLFKRQTTKRCPPNQWPNARPRPTVTLRSSRSPAVSPSGPHININNKKIEIKKN